MRPTPFGLVFGALSGERFPAIAELLAADAASSADRDRFVLLEPVGRLLRDIVPPEADADALEAHVRLLHHAYRHWSGGGWVYAIGAAALERAAAGGPVSSHLPRTALYLQLPELRVWGAPTAEGAGAAEPLDGMFVTETGETGAIAVLGVFGMREGRAGFSAVAVEGRADADDPAASETVLAAARADGSAPFTATLPGGDRAGILSVANAGELLLLTCRLLALLPASRDAGRGSGGEFVERIAEV